MTNKATNLTIVTGLYNMGRGSINADFKRSYSFYLEKFFILLESTIETPIIIFCSEEDNFFIKRVRKDNIHIINKELKDFETWFEFFPQVQEIRKQPAWYSQADWLSKSPQATLEYYNPFVMSKMFMLADATILDPFKTDNFVWLDAALVNTVHAGYFSDDKIQLKLEPYLDPFLFLSFPYETGAEIHGFPREAMNKYARTDNVKYVCRGGLFGGRKSQIKKISDIYYRLLHTTLDEGCMGTEESIFTILSYLYPKEVNRYMLEAHGMISNFCEAVKTNTGNFEPVIEKRDILSDKEKEQVSKKTFKSLNSITTGLYFLTYNFSKQLAFTLNSLAINQPDFINYTKKFLIDNSINTSEKEENKKLAESFGFEYIPMEKNIGICGGRQFVAEHFNEQDDLENYFFFEDDMTMISKNAPPCSSGFNRWIPDLFRISRNILKKENLDFLKLSFTEFFGDNGLAWSWYNVPQEVRSEAFPECPNKLNDVEPPRTRFKEINILEHIPYAKGLVHYCNWPLLMTKEGSRKIFLDPVFRFPAEQSIMSHCYQKQLKGEISAAVLLASPIEHNRIFHYESIERVEYL